MPLERPPVPACPGLEQSCDMSYSRGVIRQPAGTRAGFDALWTFVELAMPITQLRRSLVAALVLFAGACASGGATSGSNAPSSSRSVITESELPTSGTETAYDAIQRLRPDFLRTRPAQSYNMQPNGGASGPAPAPALIVNGQRAGDLSDLRQIAATALKSVRYYSIEQAKRKFGMQYDGGAIEIEYK